MGSQFHEYSVGHINARQSTWVEQRNETSSRKASAVTTVG